MFVATLPGESADTTTRTDAIVVLTGGSLRVNKGVELLQSGLSKKLFVSGVGHKVTVDEMLAANGIAPAAVSALDGRLIILGHDANDTFSNATETAEWVKKENIVSIRLVTASYHMPRSLVEFRKSLPGVKIIPHPVFPDPEKFDEWWKDKKTVNFLFVEYNKFLAAAIRAGLNLPAPTKDNG